VKLPRARDSGGAALADRLRAEYQMLRMLDLPGISQPYALEQLAGAPALVLADSGPSNLIDWTRHRPPSLAAFLGLGTQLFPERRSGRAGSWCTPTWPWPPPPRPR
jgi:hypothetical protein